MGSMLDLSRSKPLAMQSILGHLELALCAMAITAL